MQPGHVLTDTVTVSGSLVGLGEIDGRGTVTGSVTIGDGVVGGILRPAYTNGSPHLTVQQSLTLNDGATWAVTLGGDIIYSRVAAQSITLNGQVTLTLAFANGYDPLGHGKLFFLGDSTGAGAVSGTFANQTDDVSFGSNFGGATYHVLTLGGEQFAISYTGDAGTQAFDVPGGQDIVLMAVPEPGAGTTLCAGLVSLLSLRRFPRRAPGSFPTPAPAASASASPRCRLWSRSSCGR